MPVVKDSNVAAGDLNNFLASSHPHLYRSDSFRSSADDLGSVVSSESKRVSFNNDVKIKRIPNKKNNAQSSEAVDKFATFKLEAIDPAEAEAETRNILAQLEGIECSASPTPASNSESKINNKLFGLHALNNLDIAVNGKEVNSMPSYQEVRRNSVNSEVTSTPKKPPRMTHYAQPALINSDLESVMSSDLKYKKRLLEAEDSAIASGGDADDSTVTSSYTSRFIRKNVPSARLASPSRSCLTDTEILRSPSEVLYAVSDKHKHHNNEHMTSTSSQTARYTGRARSSYENQREAALYRQKVAGNSSRSLDRGGTYDDEHRSLYSRGNYDAPKSRYDDNKENTFKTRIQVISPDRQHMIQNGNRSSKPYKTMINTATDNILYRGNSTDNLSYYHYGENGGHYKVPRNKPVVMRNNDYAYRNSLQRPQPQQQFTSTRLVRNIENNRNGPVNPRYNRNRNYSGHSTSPDRDTSPDRYRTQNHQMQPRQPQQPQRSSYIQHRSPSSSPTRPPRSRSSPTRETVVRRQNSSLAASEAIRTARRGSYQVAPESDRLSRFIEYRGEDIIMPHAQDPNQTPRRPSSSERGQSLPPGATIESMRDFYKSSQYKSMHALPPSPSRPAPVLDRGQPRPRNATSAGPRVSISEGDNTDDGGGRPPEKMPRHHRRPVSASASSLRPASRPASTKRPAPSPPVAASTGQGLVVRRVVSSDGRRPLVNPNVHNVPSTRRIVVGGRRPSIDNGLDSSFSESEGFTGETDQDKQPMGDFGRRWTAASDIDSDYRRDLATNSVSGGLHQEARLRDGGFGGRLSRGSSKTNIPEILTRSASSDLERSNSNSAREEERRKVLEIEGVIRPRAAVSRSTSRASRTAHVTNAGPRGYKPVVNLPRHIDLESQYSGHSSSQTAPPSAAPVSASAKLNRFDQHRVGRVRRSTSNANAAAAMGGVRREINQRKIKLPGGSLTSSINSSESEQGSHAGQSAVSRMSNRSVFLHAAAVADIPTTLETMPRPPLRSQSAESRENIASSGMAEQRGRPVSNGVPVANSNLKGSKKISRSISLLAPWKPRPVQDKFEIHYDNGNLYANPATRVTVEPGNMPAASKPPRPPTAPPPPPSSIGGPPPVRRNMHRPTDAKSASSTDLLRPMEADTTPAVILAERKAKAEAERKAKVSRSMSMPKDSRLAGWFKKRKRMA